MTRVEAEGIAVLWEDLLQRSPLPPRVAGVTGAEYEFARLVRGGPVRVIEAPPAETWIWSDLHLRDRGALRRPRRPPQPRRPVVPVECCGSGTCS